MSTLTGKAAGLIRPIMGVITEWPGLWPAKRPQILVIRTAADLRKISLWPRLLGSLAGCIVSQDVPAGRLSLPGVIEVAPEEAAALTPGDVVYLEPQGKVVVFYQVNSPHNSLMATNRCNCLCLMCPQPPAPDPKNLLEENLRLIALMDPGKTDCLGITGGEPTLLGEDLFKLVHACRTQLPKAMITLLTNGRRLKDLDYARELVRAGFPALFIETPLFADNDTEHDEVMGAKGAFYETMAGLHNLARLGQPVGLRTVLHALTVPRLLPYCEFVYRNLPFLVQVAFMGMETMGLALKNLDRLWLDPYDYREQLARAVRYLTQRTVPAAIYNHQLCVLHPSVWPFACQSITTWKRSYPPVCAGCGVKEACGGVFGTGEKISDHLTPLPASELPRITASSCATGRPVPVTCG